MDRHETLQIMSVLKAAYESFCRSGKQEEALAKANLWQAVFANDDYSQVSAAVYALIGSKTDGYPPTPGAVREKMRLIFGEEGLSELEAWELVAKAVSQTDRYNPSAQYDKLPPEIRACIRSPQTLAEWGNVDTDSFNSVIASNFQRTYRAKMRRAGEIAALPENLKPLISGIAEKMRLPDGSGK